MPGSDEVRTIPLLEEEIVVEKRRVEAGRVVISTKVEEYQAVVGEALRREDVTVERVPIGRVVEAAPDVRQEGDILIVPVLEEEAVIVKRLILKEELHIRKNVRIEQVSAPVTLRRETAVVTREDNRVDGQQSAPTKDR